MELELVRPHPVGSRMRRGTCTRYAHESCMMRYVAALQFCIVATSACRRSNHAPLLRCNVFMPHCTVTQSLASDIPSALDWTFIKTSPGWQLIPTVADIQAPYCLGLVGKRKSAKLYNGLALNYRYILQPGGCAVKFWESIASESVPRSAFIQFNSNP